MTFPARLLTYSWTLLAELSTKNTNNPIHIADQPTHIADQSTQTSDQPNQTADQTTRTAEHWTTHLYCWPTSADLLSDTGWLYSPVFCDIL